MTNSNFDWLNWAGIEESDHDRILVEARKCGVPVFDSDSKHDIFNRLLAVKTLKSNSKMVYINIALTLVSLISAIATVYGNLKGF